MKRGLRCLFVVAASCSSCAANRSIPQRSEAPEKFEEPAVVFVNTTAPLLEVWMPEEERERGRVLAAIAVSGFHGVDVQEMSGESPAPRPCFRYAGKVWSGFGPTVMQEIREAMYRPIPGPVTAPFGLSPDEHTRFVESLRGDM